MFSLGRCDIVIFQAWKVRQVRIHLLESLHKNAYRNSRGFLHVEGKVDMYLLRRVFLEYVE